MNKNTMTPIRRLLTAALTSLLLGSTALASAQEPAPVAVEVAEEAQVDLNTATEAELCTLPGIGPAKAQAIMAHRERRPFRRIEEVMRVRGIGRATFRRLRSRLTVTR